MTKKQEGGKIEGGRVLIFSKDVINDGKIVSSGSGTKIQLGKKPFSTDIHRDSWYSYSRVSSLLFLRNW